MSLYTPIKCIVKLCLVLIGLVLSIVVSALLGGIMQCEQLKIETLVNTAETKNAFVMPVKIQKIQSELKNYYRPIESTYLTYPEWYIVYSSQEYAGFLKNNRPSQFPYFSSIEQYWCGYCTVYKLTKQYPFNTGDHLMLVVIGTSLSVEYAIKGIYENTLGRLSEWLSANEPTEEDKYAQEVAQQYAEFIPVRPWFEFSFTKSLQGLWHQTSWWGPHATRKWERKIILSAEYSAKAAYAWLIERASQTAYGVESDVTYAWINNTPASIFKNNPTLLKIKEIAKNSYIVTLPREQPFTDSVSKLIGTPIRFMDIAGNHTILLTAIAPLDWKYNLKEGTVLFTTSILTQPSLQRLAIQIPVTSLLTTLNQLTLNKVTIEHVYDY